MLLTTMTLRTFSSFLTCLVVFTLTQTPVWGEISTSKMTESLIPVILDDHNHCRKTNALGLSDLTWDKNLADFAQKYTEKLRQDNAHRPVKQTKLVHSSFDARRALPGWQPNPVGRISAIKCTPCGATISMKSILLRLYAKPSPPGVTRLNTTTTKRTAVNGAKCAATILK